MSLFCLKCGNGMCGKNGKFYCRVCDEEFSIPKGVNIIINKEVNHDNDYKTMEVLVINPKEEKKRISKA